MKSLGKFFHKSSFRFTTISFGKHENATIVDNR